MTSSEFNDAAMDGFSADILQRAAASNGKFPIPRDSSVDQIAQILTAQLESVGFVTDPEAVMERAAAMHAAFQDGSL